jgi:hypothetical protein
VARGTMSAGRLYDKIGEYGAAKVLFMFKNAIIAEMTDFQLQRGQKSESAILQWEAERSGGA